MLVAWLLGFAVFQLINPGELGWWSKLWTDVQAVLGFTPPTWMSASIASFLTAALAAGVIGAFRRR